MDDNTPPPDEIAIAIATALLRKGVLNETDIEQMCAGLSEDAAHELRCCVLDAAAPSQSDWAAEQARRGFHVVRNEGEDAG